MDDKLFSKVLEENLKKHTTQQLMYEKYFNYYKGDHEIKSKTEAGEGKPNNKLVYNFCELIVDMNHSYLFSKPYSMDVRQDNSNFFRKFFNLDKDRVNQEEFINDLQTIYFDNDEELITSKHGKITAITGVSVEVHYIDKKGHIRFKNGDPREFFRFVYEGKEYVVRHFTTTSYEKVKGDFELIEKKKMEVYTDEKVEEWEKEDDDWKKMGETPHFYDEIPVVFFYNRELVDEKDSISDLKNMIALNDSYNKASSSILNTLEYNGDPYLIFKNFGMDEDDIETFKETRIIEMLGDDVGIEFLQWNHETNAYELFLDRLERLIFILSLTPDLFNKEGMSSDSGVSLKMKFAGADLKAQQKETAFTVGLRKRIRLISKQLELKTNKAYYGSGIYRNVEITFNRNLPQNLKELVEMVNGLAGTVSEETRVKLLPFVDNAGEEIKKRKEDDDLFTDPFSVNKDEKDD